MVMVRRGVVGSPVALRTRNKANGRADCDGPIPVRPNRGREHSTDAITRLAQHEIRPESLGPRRLRIDAAIGQDRVIYTQNLPQAAEPTGSQRKLPIELDRRIGGSLGVLLPIERVIDGRIGVSLGNFRLGKTKRYSLLRHQ